MELPRRAVNVERTFALLALTAALALAWIEAGAPLAQRIQEGRPWLAWVAAQERGRDAAPRSHLLFYDTVRRRVVLLRVPETAKIRSLLPPVADRLQISLAPLWDEDEPVAEVARALKTRLRRPRAWARLLWTSWTRAPREGRAALDPLLFALELRLVPLERLEPTEWTEETPAPERMRRLLDGQQEPDDGHAVTAEVLNASGRTGLASRVAKMLRSKGVDVFMLGTTRPRARTMVYNRYGAFRRAMSVLASLDCPSARAVAQEDPRRAADVTVELGADCAGPAEPEDGDQP